MGTDDDARVAEWIDDAAPTAIDEIPTLDSAAIVDEHATPPNGVESLPGYEPGRERGRSEAYQAGVDDTLDELRLALMEGHFDAGVAFHMAEQLGRRVAARKS